MKRLNLISARVKHFGTQQALADALPVTRQELSCWERGTVAPQSYNQQRLLEELHCDDLGELLRIFEDVAPPGASPPGQTQNEEDETLMEEETRTPRIQITPTPTLATFLTSTLNVSLLHIAHTDYSNPDDMTTAIQSALKDTTMNLLNDEITRRTALLELASLPLITLGRTQTLHSRRYDEMLRHCTAALEACWELYRGSDAVADRHAFECACTYEPLLENIARDSSRHRKQALDLAAQYALMRTMLSWGCLERVESISHAQHALDTCKASGNILLQLSAHSKLSYTYRTAGRYFKALETMQEGEAALKRYQRAKKSVPLPRGVIGNIYSGYAQVQLANGIDPDMALSVAAESPAIEGRLAFMEFTDSSQWQEIAWTYSAKGDSKQAMLWLEKLIDPEALTPYPVGQSEHEQVETLNTLTQALLQSPERDLGQVVKTWVKAMEWTQSHKREVLYQEAMANFAAMRALYPGEKAIMKLAPLTAHW